MRFAIIAIATCAVLLGTSPADVRAAEKPFNVVEASIDDIQKAIFDRKLTARAVVQMYLDRIAAYDKKGPKINAVITLNPKALEEADRLDAAFARDGKLTGPLHGIPVLLKDQADVGGLPTTLGSVVLKDYVPTKDAGAVVKLKQAGAIILAKMTLGELGGNDTYGSLFGETRNPYDLTRTVGGSSGGPAAGVNANFGTVGIGEEDNASIRRPSGWNALVGIRPSPGVVTRTGMWAGYPSPVGSLGPMTHTVTDAAKVLDAMAGYDPEDPVTALGRGHIPDTYTKFLDKDGLKGARIGVLRQQMAANSEPDSEDFKRVTAVFNKAVDDLRAAAGVLRGQRAAFFARNPNPTFKSNKDILASPEYGKTMNAKRTAYAATRPATPPQGTAEERYARYVIARDRLNIQIAKIMADNDLAALVHKTVEHTPTLIKDGVNPPYTSAKGVPSLNTFLIYTTSMTVPAGYTDAGLPVGITFFAPAFQEPTILKLGYAYEQATHHRVPPKTTPPLKAK